MNKHNYLDQWCVVMWVGKNVDIQTGTYAQCFNTIRSTIYPDY